MSSNYKKEVVLRYLPILLLFFLDLNAAKHERVSLQLQWRHQFESAGFYAAIEKGFYAQEGLDVTLLEASGGMDSVEAVLGKKADFGITYSSLLAKYLQGKEVVMLANIFKHSPLVLLTQEEIRTPLDLKGKKVMTNQLEIHDIGITSMLEHYNITPADFKLVEQDYMLDSFINKKVDAKVAFMTNEPYILSKKGIKYNILSPQNYGSQFYDVNIFTSLAQVKKDPKKVEAFRRASLRGWRYALKNSDEIIEIILRKYNSQNKTKEALEYEASVIKKLILPDVYKVGSIDCNIITNMTNEFLKVGKNIKSNNINLDNFLFDQTCKFNTQMSFTKDEFEYLQNKKEIKACVEPNIVPLQKLGSGEYVGVSVDFLKTISSIISLPISITPTKSINESVKLLSNGNCQIASLEVVKNEHIKSTVPFVSIPLVIATTNDKFFISNLREIKDRNIGIIKDYPNIDALKAEYQSISFIEVDSIDDGLKKVANKELFGFVGNLISLSQKIQKEYMGTLKISGHVGRDFELKFGVNERDKILLDILNKAILEIDDRTKQDIINEWISTNNKQDIDYTWLWRVIAMTTAILIFGAYRYRILQRNNEQMAKYLNIIDRYVLISSSDRDGRITEVSQALCDLTGYTKDELIGKKHSILKYKSTPREHYGSMWSTISSGKVWQGELINQKKDGSEYWVESIISPNFSKNGEIDGYSAIRHNISDRKIAEKLSVTDPLTQAYNRLHLDNSLKLEIQRARRYDLDFCVIIIDIDYFKKINDAYGHDVGDTVLVKIVAILQENIRTTDILGRWGGEEFLVICPETKLDEAAIIAEKLRMLLENFDFSIGQKVTSSFGVSEFMGEDMSFNDVIKRADRALYDAKHNGRNRISINCY